MPPQRTMKVDVTYTSLFRIVAVALVVVSVLYLRQIAAALLFAVVIASSIEPGVQWFRRYRIPRVFAVLIIYFTAFGVIAGVVYLVLPAVIDEFNAFLDSFPSYQRILLQELRSFQGLPFYSLFSGNAEEAILNPPLDIRLIGGNVVGFLASVFGGIFSGVILIVVSFYLANQERGVERFLRLVTPLKNEEYIISLWARSQKKIGQWLRGQLLLGLVIGILIYIALTVLGMRYALILALLAAVFEVIPVIGPILAAVPAVFFAFLISPLQALIVGVVYFIIQQLENHLLVPLVSQRIVGVNPLVVVLALLIGAKLGGILGMFLAVPLSSVLVELFSDIDRRRREPSTAGAGTTA